MNRRHVAALILVGWLGAAGWLVKREYFPAARARFDDVVLNVSPGATYYRLMVGDEQVGYASTTVDTLADTVRQLDLVILHVPTAGATRRVESRIVSNLTRGLELRSFKSAYRSESVRYDASGWVEGDSVLVVNVETGTPPLRTTRIPIATRLAFPPALPLQLAFHRELEVGREYQFDLFDPLLLERRLTTLRVTAESTWVVPDSADLLDGATEWTPATYVTLRSWRVEHSLGGIPFAVWVDEVGHVVDIETPLGFHAERTAYEIAYENFVDAGIDPVLARSGAPLVRATVIEAGAAPPRTSLAALRLRLRGTDLAGLAGFTSKDLQHAVPADTVIVATDTAALSPEYRLPARDPALRRFLVPEPLMPSNDPRITSQARRIVGRTTHPTRAARLLSEWVDEALAKRRTVGLVSAIDVLEDRRGDSNEHTVLFVALARALGLPARPVAGLVYVDGTFYYHAWPEVYLNGWVGVDPTLGQTPVDATYLRLSIGGLARPAELIKLLGGIDLEVLEERTE